MAGRYTEFIQLIQGDFKPPPEVQPNMATVRDFLDLWVQNTKHNLGVQFKKLEEAESYFVFEEQRLEDSKNELLYFERTRHTLKSTIESMKEKKQELEVERQSLEAQMDIPETQMKSMPGGSSEFEAYMNRIEGGEVGRRAPSEESLGVLSDYFPESLADISDISAGLFHSLDLSDDFGSQGGGEDSETSITKSFILPSPSKKEPLVVDIDVNSHSQEELPANKLVVCDISIGTRPSVEQESDSVSSTGGDESVEPISKSFLLPSPSQQEPVVVDIDVNPHQQEELPANKALICDISISTRPGTEEESLVLPTIPPAPFRDLMTDQSFEEPVKYDDGPMIEFSPQSAVIKPSRFYPGMTPPMTTSVEDRMRHRGLKLATPTTAFSRRNRHRRRKDLYMDGYDSPEPPMGTGMYHDPSDFDEEYEEEEEEEPNTTIEWEFGREPPRRRKPLSPGKQYKEPAWTSSRIKRAGREGETDASPKGIFKHMIRKKYNYRPVHLFDYYQSPISPWGSSRRYFRNVHRKDVPEEMEEPGAKSIEWEGGGSASPEQTLGPRMTRDPRYTPYFQGLKEGKYRPRDVST